MMLRGSVTILAAAATLWGMAGAAMASCFPVAQAPSAILPIGLHAAALPDQGEVRRSARLVAVDDEFKLACRQLHAPAADALDDRLVGGAVLNQVRDRADLQSVLLRERNQIR